MQALEHRDPAKSHAIIADRATGMSYKAIQEKHGVNFRTIVRLCDQNPEEFRKWRARAANKAQRVAELAIERIGERLEGDLDCDLKTMAVTFGIVADKALTLNDQPNVITEARKALTVEDAKRAIEEARKRISAEVVDV